MGWTASDSRLGRETAEELRYSGRLGVQAGLNTARGEIWRLKNQRSRLIYANSQQTGNILFTIYIKRGPTRLGADGMTSRPTERDAESAPGRSVVTAERPVLHPHPDPLTLRICRYSPPSLTTSIAATLSLVAVTLRHAIARPSLRHIHMYTMEGNTCALSWREVADRPPAPAQPIGPSLMRAWDKGVWSTVEVLDHQKTPGQRIWTAETGLLLEDQAAGMKVFSRVPGSSPCQACAR
ncbi:unnamed protein product [Protopolystoma xenopodis]|uniref:Uncharacterized protein n=1 Tax=Protopolystoma xenopodis TaxID=117903 RepID=A0A448WRF8_9PLAT|nr:unnamed protein product [Protopolystoma xenopodis]